MHDPIAWSEQILCSTPERAALQRLHDLGLHDSLRLFDESAGHYSWWDYRMGGFRRNLGLRIDPRLNEQNHGIISTPDSRVTVRVMKTNEELVIAARNQIAELQAKAGGGGR